MLLEVTNAVDTDFTVRWRLPMTVVGLQTKHRNMLMDDAAEPAAQITTPVLKARCLQAIRQDNLRAVRVLLRPVSTLNCGLSITPLLKIL